LSKLRPSSAYPEPGRLERAPDTTWQDQRGRATAACTD